MRYIFLFLLLLAGNVHAEKFHLTFTDIFPMCASEVSNDPEMNLRCFAEFFVPNFHLGAIVNMFIKSTTSFFLIDDLVSFIDDFFTDPVGAVAGVGSSFLTGIWHIVFPEEGATDQGISGTFTSIVGGVINWLLGVLTPFLVIIGLILIEFVKTYLTYMLIMALLNALLLEINLSGSSPFFSIALVVLFVAFMFVASVLFLTVDMNLFVEVPFVRW
jgi:hypothetical protein